MESWINIKNRFRSTVFRSFIPFFFFNLKKIKEFSQKKKIKNELKERNITSLNRF